MIERNVHFENMLEVTEFVRIASGLQEEIVLFDEDYQADAKSLLGIFSMDISRPLRVLISGSEEGEREACAALEYYIIERRKGNEDDNI